jgi:hypothetical protein
MTHITRAEAATLPSTVATPSALTMEAFFERIFL